MQTPKPDCAWFTASMKPVNAIGEALATSYTTGHTSSPTVLDRVAPNGSWGTGWTDSWCHLGQMSPAAMGSPAHSDSAAVLLGWEGCEVRCLSGKGFTPVLWQLWDWSRKQGERFISEGQIWSDSLSGHSGDHCVAHSLQSLHPPTDGSQQALLCFLASASASASAPGVH